MISRWVEDLWASPQYEGQFVHHQIIPARHAKTQEYPDFLHPKLKTLLAKQGVNQLYGHQRRALDALREGKNVAVTTAT